MSTLDTVLLTVVPAAVTAGAVATAKLKYGWAFSEFKTWQLILACLHLSIAITMYGLTGASNDAWEVVVGLAYNKWDVNDIGACSDETPCYIDLVNEELGTFKTTFLVPFFSVCSGLHHLYAAYSLGRGDGIYKDLVLSGINVARWLDYAISSSLMIVILDLLFVAPPDFRSLAFAGIVQALIIVGGYGSDVARVGNLWNHARGIFWAASIMYLFFFATQITVFVKGTTESGAPAVVNLFVGFIFGTFTAFAIVQGFFTEKEKTIKDESERKQLRVRQELWFSALSFFSKASTIPLLVTFYFGLTTRTSNAILVRPMTTSSTAAAATTTTPEPDETEMEQYVPFIVTTALSSVLGVIMIWWFKPTISIDSKGKYTRF